MKHYKAFIYGFSSKADFKKDRTTSKRTAMLFNMGILVNIVEEFSNI